MAAPASQAPPTEQVPEPFLGGSEPEPILPKAAPTEEPIGPQHSQRSLRLAHVFGYAQADIEAMSPAQLDASVDQMNLFRLRQAKEQEQRFLAMNNRDRQPVPPRPAAPQPAEESLEEFDPKLARIINRLTEENKQLRSQHGQIVENERRRHVSQMDDAIDGGFEAMAKSHGHLFGTGPAGTLPKDSPEMKRRIKIIRAAGILNSDSPRQIAAKIKEAVNDLIPAAAAPEPEERSVYGDALNGTPAKPARKRGANGQFLTEEEERWQNGALAKPRSRTTSAEPDGRDKATRSVAKLLQERGEFAGSDAGDQTLDDLFPDMN